MAKKVKRGVTMCVELRSGDRRKKLCRRIGRRTLQTLVALDRRMDRMLEDLTT